MPLRSFYKTSLQVNKSFLLGLFFVLAFLGLLDAGFIAYTHYAHIVPPCINNGCELVLTSKYTELAGIPNAVIGIFYYGLVMVLVWMYWKNHKLILTQTTGPLAFLHQTIPFLLLILTLLGLVAGIYLLYLQAALIHAYCQYCVTSEVIDFLLFDCAWWLWRRSEKELH